MIARLVLLDAARSWRLWCASFVVMVAAALVALVCAGDVATARSLADPVDRAGLMNHAMIFGTMNAVVVIGSLWVLITFTVRLQRRGYALWQFAGVGPGTIRRVVLGQALVVALVALAVALALLPWALSAVMTVLSAPLRDIGAPPLTATLGLVEVLVAGGAYLAVVLLSALSGARAARSTPALLAVRDVEEPDRGPGRLRVAFAIVTAVLFVGMLVAMAFGVYGITSMFLVPAMLLVVVTAPWLVPIVMRGWTRLVPSSAPAWLLAREAAAFASARSHAAVSLFTVTLLLGAFTGLAGLWDEGSDPAAGLAIFGTPVAVVLLTGTSTVLVTALGRRRDTALAIVVGSTWRTATAAAVLEAVIVVVTSLLIALPLALLSSTAALTSWTDPLRPVPPLAGVALVVMLLATTAPVGQVRRRALGPVLAGAGA